MFLKPPTSDDRPGKAKRKVESSEERKDSKKKYDKTKRVRTFQESWRTQFPWVEYEEDEEPPTMSCSLCKANPTVADSTSSLYVGTSQLRYDTLKTHDISKKHVACRTAKTNLSMDTTPLAEGIHNMEKSLEEEMTNIMHAAYYIAKRELPLVQFSQVHSLCRRVGAKLPNYYDSDKACARFITTIYAQEREKIIDEIRNAPFISILIDGATDTAHIENEIVYVKYLGADGPKTVFLGIKDVAHADATGVLGAVEDVFKAAGMESDWKEKTVGFGSDGAAVNLGIRTGVITQLRGAVTHDIIALHCLAHRLELGVVSAINENPNMQRLQETLRHLYDEYHLSPKATRELHAVAEALEEKVLKPTTLRGTRWLPYVHRAVKIVCVSYRVLRTHFEELCHPDRRPKPSAAQVGRAVKVVRYLSDYEDVLFLHFMADVFDYLANLSKAFQRDNATACEAVQELETCYLNLTSLQTELGPLAKPFLQAIVQTGKYKDMDLKNCTQTTISDTRKKVTGDVIDCLDARMGDLQRDSTISKFVVFDPASLPRFNKADLETFTKYGRDEVGELYESFNSLMQKRDITADQTLSDYNKYKVYASKRTTMSTRDVFIDIVLSDKKKTYPNLTPLMEIYLVLPVSTATCERGFSAMKRIKSPGRSSMEIPELNHLLFLSVEGPTEDEFKAHDAVRRWWEDGKRSKRPGFTAWAPKELPVDGFVIDDDNDDEAGGSNTSAIII